MSTFAQTHTCLSARYHPYSNMVDGQTVGGWTSILGRSKTMSDNDRVSMEPRTQLKNGWSPLNSLSLEFQEFNLELKNVPVCVGGID